MFLTVREHTLLYRLKTSVLQPVFENVRLKGSYIVEELKKNYKQLQNNRR